jgi:hypothetical protein
MSEPSPPLFVSLHLPKTAGSTFSSILKEWYGPRLLLDYGDLVGDESRASCLHRERRRQTARENATTIAKDYSAIHGHFYAPKYLDIFPNARFSVFFRDPLTRIPSYFHYLTRCQHHRNPLVRAIRSSNMTLDEFIRWDYMRNLCARMIGPLSVNDFWFVGIQEHYMQSVRLLAAMLGKSAPMDIARKNTNPLTGRNSPPRCGVIRGLMNGIRTKIGGKPRETEPVAHAADYHLTRNQARSICRYHSEDMELYKRARIRLEALISNPAP